MSEESKKKVEQAEQFFKEVQEGAKEFKGIPDPGLQKKIQKVGEDAGEVVKHIKERTDH
jgi:hypothetical protein